MNRDFKGIWIPREIWLAKGLKAQEKILWAEIHSLFDREKGGCYASNEYLAEFIGVQQSRMREMLANLKLRGYLIQVSFDGRCRVLRAVMPPEDINNQEDMACGGQSAGKPAGSMPEKRQSDQQESGSLSIYREQSLEKSIETHTPTPQNDVAIAPVCVFSSSSKKQKISKLPAEIDANVKVVAEKLAAIAKEANPACRPHLPTYYEYVGKLMLEEKQQEEDLLRAMKYACNDKTVSEDGKWNGWSPLIAIGKGIILFHKRFEMILQRSKCEKDRRFAPCSDWERAQEAIDAAKARAIS